MFGMTAVTAWELEAERRQELAISWKSPATEPVPRRDRGRTVFLRRLVDALRQAPPAGWEDVRT